MDNQEILRKKTIIVLTVLIVGFIGIQFIPVKRTNPAVVYDFDGPSDVKAVLQRSCYDCHSNEADWPWYSHVAPVSWLVAHDVKEARDHLNFSDWEPLKDQTWVPDHVYKMVANGEMPPKIYLLMHSDAKVSSGDLAVLRQWAEARADSP